MCDGTKINSWVAVTVFSRAAQLFVVHIILGMEGGEKKKILIMFGRKNSSGFRQGWVTLK